MAKSKSTFELSGTFGGLTFVRSRAYGNHVRAARGTHKKAKINPAFKKASKLLLKANKHAKILRDALVLHLDGIEAKRLWNRLVSIFFKQLKAKGVVNYIELKDFELDEDKPMDRFLDVQPGVRRDRKKHIIRVKLSYPAHPLFEKTRYINGYRLGMIGIFPDAARGRGKSTAHYTRIIRLKENVEPLTFEMLVPASAKHCLLCLKVEGCEGDAVTNTTTTKGMRVVWSGLV